MASKLFCTNNVFLTGRQVTLPNYDYSGLKNKNSSELGGQIFISAFLIRFDPKIT